ncbi:MAG: ABC transporter ATP-binding protein [Alphaproteobacteria bacterium]
MVRDYESGDEVLHVLRSVSLDLFPGETVGLIGPSGSGKSSLLHAAGLLEKPTGGAVFIAGKDCSKLRDGERTRIRLGTIGFVYQFHHLLPEFTALDNVALPAMVAGVKGAVARERARELLHAMDLDGRMDHIPAKLSGGERQRVAMARALINGPRIILADEPTGNLDPANSGQVFDGLNALVKRTGAAALIATHNHALAGHMDRVYALETGKLVRKK